MEAVWNGQTIAGAGRDKLIYIERNWYFPPESVNQDRLRRSGTPYTCPWKGECRYFDVGRSDEWGKDNAWTYPQPKKSAIRTVKKGFTGYVAFWRDVQVVE